MIDTVGIKVGPLAMVDWYGTPHTEALHVMERYRTAMSATPGSPTKPLHDPIVPPERDPPNKPMHDPPGDPTFEPPQPLTEPTPNRASDPPPEMPGDPPHLLGGRRGLPGASKHTGGYATWASPTPTLWRRSPRIAGARDRGACSPQRSVTASLSGSRSCTRRHPDGNRCWTLAPLRLRTITLVPNPSRLGGEIAVPLSRH